MKVFFEAFLQDADFKQLLTRFVTKPCLSLLVNMGILMRAI